MEHTLDTFPAWIQTVAYIGAALIGLVVASHGYFKAWIKKIAPGKDPVAAVEGKTISSLMVIDAIAVRNLADALLRIDQTLRSVQDDMRRGHDKGDKSRDQMEDLIDLLKLVKDRGESETMKGRDHD